MADELPTVRRDPILDRWVLFAPQRGGRPILTDAGPAAACAFCEGRERETPHELYADRPGGSPSDGPGWRVRVVPNAYPAARADALGWGRHEVVIECPGHVADLADLPPDQVARVLRAYRERLRTLQADPRVRYVQVFKNHGRDAGASVEHAHSQILALDRVPPTVQRELDAGERHHATTGRCLWCDWLSSEVASGERVVRVTPRFAAVCAFAGRFPYETWLLPRDHGSDFATVDDAGLDDLADLLATTLGALVRAAGRGPYNLLLHTAPVGPGLPHFHWHWELLPRRTGTAGFEWATGDGINPVLPEVAAQRLRST